MNSMTSAQARRELALLLLLAGFFIAGLGATGVLALYSSLKLGPKASLTIPVSTIGWIFLLSAVANALILTGIFKVVRRLIHHAPGA